MLHVFALPGHIAGYDSYTSYLRSSEWQRVKALYRRSGLPQDCMCGATDVQLHHVTYERVGGEEWPDDLRPLCPACHAMVHVLERRGDIELDLKGLYDVKRAERNANETIRMVQERAYEFHGQILRVFTNTELFTEYLLATGLSRRDKYHCRRTRHFARAGRRSVEARILMLRYKLLSQRLALLEGKAQQSPIARELEAIKRQIQRAEAKCVQAGGTGALALDERDAA